MKKLSPFFALSISALLLTGCAANVGPAAEATDSDASASPAATATVSPSPASSPAGSAVAAPTAEPAAASPAPTTEPTTPEPTAEATPAPTTEPTMEAEPTEEPSEEPITETSEPPIPGLSGSYDDLELVSTWDGQRVVRHVGTTWNIAGSGYAPGAEIQVIFTPVQSDYSLIGYPVTYADANGNYTFEISLGPDLEPGDYGVMAVPLGLSSEETEAAKRFSIIEVVSTWAP
ncbi:MULTISPECIES: hypothetical protein [unclassified Arthrobacter]|uniref:hypothetical protein n=1 Tax=unclassified Arthrobacter TaxID=235627 RepID=UPI001491CE0D|nr:MULTISPECIES: hypothetical protein [unclassified Arthrobacter]NOJ63252.1 hypothetical protein [Arthrobacter sp. 147(2020)]